MPRAGRKGGPVAVREHTVVEIFATGTTWSVHCMTGPGNAHKECNYVELGPCVSVPLPSPRTVQIELEMTESQQQITSLGVVLEEVLQNTCTEGKWAGTWGHPPCHFSQLHLEPQSSSQKFSHDPLVKTVETHFKVARGLKNQPHLSKRWKGEQCRTPGPCQADRSALGGAGAAGLPESQRPL